MTGRQLKSADMATTTRRIAVRWSDFDSLGHVNNVAYVAYSDAAWPLPSGQAWRNSHVGEMTVQYRHAIGPEVEAVDVDTGVAKEAAWQTIRLPDDTIAAELRFESMASTMPPAGPGGLTRRFTLRPGDTDRDGFLTRTSIFELLQEGRIRFNDTVLPAGPGRRFVVASQRLSITDRHAGQAPELSIRTLPVRIGGRSVRLRNSVSDEHRMLLEAETVLVAFDPDTGRSRELEDYERIRLASTMEG